MSKAITTKYIGPTNHKGAHISVRAEGLPRMYVHWDDELCIDGNHTAAAKQFAAKYDWAGQWCGGVNAASSGNTYVRIPSFTVENPGLFDDDINFNIPRK